MNDNIIKTLAFFSLFNHPLTQDELLKYSWGRSVAPSDGVIPAQAGIQVDEETGLYFLEGHKNIVDIRRQRQRDLDKKTKIAQRAVKKLRFVPFLRAVFLCNNVAMGTADKDSDIDIFIVVRDGRIWITRFFATLFLHFFRLRRHGRKIKNRVCLSFYCSDKYLNLREIRIQPPDVYLVYWLASLIPIYDPENLEEKIQQANKWILEYVPNGFLKDKVEDKVEDSKFSKIFKNFFEKSWKGRYGDVVEKQLREIQKTKMKMNLYSKQKENGNEVIINDRMLKFHENDRRKYYQKLWLEKVKQLTELNL